MLNSMHIVSETRNLIKTNKRLLKHHRIPLEWSELSSAVVQSLLIVLIGIFTDLLVEN